MNKKQVGKGFIIGVCDGMNIFILLYYCNIYEKRVNEK